jgi:hypothetical protein
MTGSEEADSILYALNADDHSLLNLRIATRCIAKSIRFATLADGSCLHTPADYEKWFTDFSQRVYERMVARAKKGTVRSV